MRPAITSQILIEERFWSKVDKTGDCWLWKAGTNDRGYGVVISKGKAVYAHRFAYELVKGPIPASLTLDHLCRNPACVNPSHLEPLSLKENILRGQGPSAQHSRQTHCVHGHPLSGENLYIRRDTGGRQCKSCIKIKKAEFYATDRGKKVKLLAQQRYRVRKRLN